MQVGRVTPTRNPLYVTSGRTTSLHIDSTPLLADQGHRRTLEHEHATENQRPQTPKVFRLTPIADSHPLKQNCSATRPDRRTEKVYRQTHERGQAHIEDRAPASKQRRRTLKV